MKTGGGWAGLGVSGGTENQEGNGLPGAWDRGEESGLLPAPPDPAPPDPAGRAATLPVPSAPASSRGRAAGCCGGPWPGHKAGLRAVSGGLPAPGPPAMAGWWLMGAPNPSGSPSCRTLGTQVWLPRPARLCSVWSSSRLCRRQRHCGCPGPFRPFRWKCPGAGEWRPCSRSEGRGQPPLSGREGGEERSGAPVPAPAAPLQFLGRQSWRAGVVERSGTGRRCGTSLEQVCGVGACCPYAGVLQRYWCCEGRLWSRLRLPAAPGLGVLEVASLEMSLHGQSCSVTIMFGSLTGCLWHGSGATCLLSLHAC